MKTVINRIIELLQKQIGLNVTSIGRSAVEYAVRTRMTDVGMSGGEDYWELLNTSDELQALIEVVVVPETWFFRHVEAFEAMADFVMTEWMPRNPVGDLRILSVPCSTGEEPYSIAMALLDAGFPIQRVTIEALDVSTKVLQHAQAGFYRPYSFRNEDLRFRDRHFAPEGNGYRLSRTVRSLVHFQQKNILNLHCGLNAQKYNVIFCRNLLIYLDHIGQEAVVTCLEQCLHQGGRLFSSPAEHGVFKNGSFRSIGPIGASAFEKIKANGERTSPATPFRKSSQDVPKPKITPAKIVLTSPALSAVTMSSLPATKVASTNPVVKPAEVDSNTLERVAALADAGCLGEAASLCESYVREKGHSERTFYLQGLLKDAAGEQDEAEKLYRKALYMNPNHVQALLHLASIRAIANDEIQARQLRERARRIQQREDS